MRYTNCSNIIIILALVGSFIATTTWAYQSSTSVSSSSTITTTTSVIRLRANKLRRPESCRESLPRKSDDLPALVIVGRVKEVYLAGAAAAADPMPSNPSDPSVVAGGQQQQNKALVTIGRVVKGNQQMVGTDIIVGGFNSSTSSPCPNYVKPNDTWIMLLAPDGGDRKYSIHGSNLLSLNLNNLDRVNAVAADEPYKRRPAIEDILCEAHYCAYGRCAIINEQAGTVSCQCPDQCGPMPSPVCGSDNATYTNECHLIREGCRLKRPLFVTKELPC